MTINDYAVQIENVSFSYGNQTVLSNVFLNIKRGDFTAIIGPNGGGKTTLIKLILGILKPNSGKILLFSDIPQKARKMAGYIPQEPSSNKSFPISVLDVVLMGLLSKSRLLKPFTKKDKERAMAVLNELKILELYNKNIGELSGGQRQKVFLARAIISNPQILFLDEPTSSIDPVSQDEIYEYLKNLNNNGITIVIITHNISALSSYVKSIACVNKNLFFHPDGILDKKSIEQTFGCPVDLIAHGLPHRVYHEHDHY
jgi:zinc transport system ATP-binding protein